MEQNATLTAKQERFIAAYLAENSILAASQKCGINKTTAHRWMKQPAFKAALAAAQHALFEEKLGILRAGIGTALSTLARNMADKKEIPPAVQVRAATVWLEQAITVHKLEDVLSGLADLRQRLDANEN